MKPVPTIAARSAETLSCRLTFGTVDGLSNAHSGLTIITVCRNNWAMPTPALILLSAVVLLACTSLGGGVYEFVVLDPVWPSRPAIIQARHGGVSRRRFWIPMHSVFEVTLIAAVIVTWGHSDVRAPLLVALASQVLMRVWSLVDFVPKAVAFEKTDPAVIERAAAVRWTRRSLLRLPLDVVTCVATLVALVAAAS
jgi:hypothetical protein